MIEYRESGGQLSFKVKVVPRASRTQVAGVQEGALKVRLAAPPVEGAANEELVRTLAKELRVPRRAVEITGGHASRLKQVRVSGATSDALRRLAGPTED
ncbi:MAG TPA: DUF167 domain-containing protein [Pyrinomonadaceae bacterium]